MCCLNYKISVIVPAYNVEKYICVCIDSLLEQTYKNYELLLVDDGSTDNTGRILDEKYSENEKIKVYHKNNGGLSDARNYALDRMNGDYVTFVDSDDFVDRDYLAYLIRIITKENADIAVIPPQPFEKVNQIDTDFDLNYETVNTEEAVRRMLIRENIAHTACGKIYKYSIWKEIRFPYKKLYEDYHTTFDAFARAKKVSIGNAKMYFYYQRESSIMHLKCDKNTVSIVQATTEVTPRIIEYWPRLKEEAIDLQISLCLKCLQNIYANGTGTFKDIQKYIRKLVKKNTVLLIMTRKINFKDKIKIIISYLPPRMYLAIYNKFDGRHSYYKEKK